MTLSILKVKKGDFLLNKHNKRAFLEMFGTQLSASGINIMHSDGDADLNIVSSALTFPKTCPLTLYAEDTDLPIFLLGHYNLVSSSPRTILFRLQ